ncbi:hypothetical protein [Halomonas lysinitropha]|uniref:SMODS and SLOG-associating 2TM effector domain-containing protein n=1 Tax=Halomonas lysinitropha TaxID=2607506 RepID=A0A5K1I8H2_9GAMM|nr:hypothetical protein [Halomonas lysinitropha]VVZ96463.1 hypothetical protein HALO32_02563 [Halomonas lysinitropha]
MSPERNEGEFTVYTSYNVEKLTETLNARADRLCTFLLILLGSAVLADITSTVALGLTVTTVAALQFVCRFGEAAGQARSQKLRYASLLARRQALSDTELIDQFERIHEHDSRPLAAIEEIAFNKACLQRGRNSHMAPLSLSARMLALLVGGQPCEPERSQKPSDDAVKTD